MIVRIYLNKHIYLCIYVCIYIYLYIYAYIYIYVQRCIRLFICKIFIYINLDTYICIRMIMYIRIYIYIYIRMYIYLFIHIYISIDAHTRTCTQTQQVRVEIVDAAGNLIDTGRYFIQIRPARELWERSITPLMWTSDLIWPPIRRRRG